MGVDVGSDAGVRSRSDLAAGEGAGERPGPSCGTGIEGGVGVRADVGRPPGVGVGEGEGVGLGEGVDVGTGRGLGIRARGAGGGEVGRGPGIEVGAGLGADAETQADGGSGGDRGAGADVIAGADLIPGVGVAVEGLRGLAPWWVAVALGAGKPWVLPRNGRSRSACRWTKPHLRWRSCSRRNSSPSGE
jgi:hypothetical protein